MITGFWVEVGGSPKFREQFRDGCNTIRYHRYAENRSGVQRTIQDQRDAIEAGEKGGGMAKGWSKDFLGIASELI